MIINLNSMIITSQLAKLDNLFPVNQDNINEFQTKGHTLVHGVLSADKMAVYRPIIVNAAEKYNTEMRKMADRDTYGKAFLQIMNLWLCVFGVFVFVLSNCFVFFVVFLLVVV